MLSDALAGARSCDALLIGASAGGVEALSSLLPAVPRLARIPVVVVVHLPPSRPSLLPEVFAARCQARVCEAEDKQPVKSGTIWFAPANYHLLIERDRTFSLSVDEAVKFSRPAIDVLFESAADAYGSKLCVLVLTGANDDGALGARAIRNAGGTVVVQDPATADAKEMPNAAIALANPQLVAALPELAELLRQATEMCP
jgi:two-component system chemotaxis response regulator CheB